MLLPPTMLRDDDLPALTAEQIDRLVSGLIQADATRPVGRPRPRRWAGLSAAAAITAGLLLVPAIGPDKAVPTAGAWTPIPAPLDPAATATLVSACQQDMADTGDTRLAVAERRGRSAAVVLDSGALCVEIGGIRSTLTGQETSMISGGWQGPPPARPGGDGVRVVSSGFAGGYGFAPGTGDAVQSWDGVIVAVQAVVGPEVTSGQVTLADGEVVTATVGDGWLLAWWPKGIAPTVLTTQSPRGTRSTPVTANPADWATVPTR